MEIQGIAVRPTPLFVRQRFGARFEEWTGGLSEGCRAIMVADIDTNRWYPLRLACIEPTTTICRLFFGGESAGAREVGRFSADYALRGLYQKFAAPKDPGQLVAQSAEIFSAYYRPSRIVVRDNQPGRAVIEIESFPEIAELLEIRIAGWMERALEICGVLGVQVAVPRSLARGDPVTRFVAAWR